MASLKSSLFLCLVCLLLHGILLSSMAQADVISANGLSLPCPDCTDHGNGYCESGLPDARVLKKCEVLFAEVLLAGAKESLYNSGIDERKALSVLVGPEPVAEPVANALFELLLGSSTGQKLVENHFSALLRKQRGLLVAQLVDRRVDAEIAQRIWHSYFLTFYKSSDVMQAFLSGAIDLSAANVVEKIARVSPEDQVDVVRSIKNALPPSKSGLANGLDKVIAALNWCAKIRVNFVPTGCAVDQVEESPFYSLVNKVKAYRIQNAVVAERSEFSTLALLGMLSQMDYVSYRNYQTHDLVMDILRQAQQNNNYRWVYGVDEAVSQMLGVFAANDSQILGASQRLAKRALHQAKSVQERATAQAFGELVGLSFANPKNLISQVFLFLALGLALVGLTGLLVRQFKVEDSKISVEEARQDAMKLALAQQQNRLELDSLLRYFDLQAGAKEYELRKEYARRAKILHPDTGQRGVNQEFNELQSRYARARKLINER